MFSKKISKKPTDGSKIKYARDDLMKKMIKIAEE